MLSADRETLYVVISWDSAQNSSVWNPQLSLHFLPFLKVM